MSSSRAAEQRANICKNNETDLLYHRSVFFWLPLTRELSAQLTEGEILYGQVYGFADTAEIAVDLQIADPQHG